MVDSGNIILLELWRKYVLENTNPRIWGGSFLPPPPSPQVPPSARVSGLFLVLNCSRVWWELQPTVSCSYEGCSYKGGWGVLSRLYVG